METQTDGRLRRLRPRMARELIVEVLVYVFNREWSEETAVGTGPVCEPTKGVIAYTVPARVPVLDGHAAISG